MVINDMAMEGVESLTGKYLTLIYQDQLETFVKTHIRKDNVHGRNGGAHIDYLEWFLRKSGKPFITGDRCCIGDLAIWHIVDNLMRIFEADIKPHYPLLMSYRERIAEIPSIKQYLASPRRPAQVNGNKLG
ncbi:glutathione S-transferase [Dunaliella salina]|uniref:Glutathione S-transferase n=1 Tax=Dunaliella salina TaxID=3046 RepID=A0ABQ7HAN7_DUNSA|nr:glutathione S-transferase [Dunaliella salina]|eukprot:KAF5843917.1 glutathione S-transferase [Dunaliella salina]